MSVGLILDFRISFMLSGELLSLVVTVSLYRFFFTSPRTASEYSFGYSMPARNFACPAPDGATPHPVAPGGSLLEALGGDSCPFAVLSLTP